MLPKHADGLTLTSEGEGLPRLVVMTGRLDAASQAHAERFLEDLVASGARLVLLECSGVEFISSAGVRPLLALVKRVKPLGGGVSVCAARPQVRQMLEFSGLRALLAISDTVEEGRTALANRGTP